MSIYFTLTPVCVCECLTVVRSCVGDCGGPGLLCRAGLPSLLRGLTFTAQQHFSSSALTETSVYTLGLHNRLFTLSSSQYQTGAINTLALIYETCVRPKTGVGQAYADSYAKLGIYQFERERRLRKNLTSGLNSCTQVSKSVWPCGAAYNQFNRRRRSHQLITYQQWQIWLF